MFKNDNGDLEMISAYGDMIREANPKIPLGFAS